MPVAWLDVNVILSPAHNGIAELPVITGNVEAVVTTTTLSVDEHPPAFVTVTLYVPDALTDFVAVVSPPGDHRYVEKVPGTAVCPIPTASIALYPVTNGEFNAILICDTLNDVNGKLILFFLATAGFVAAVAE